MSKHDAALRDYDRVLELDPTNKAGRIGRARCLSESDIDRGIEALQAFARECPDEFLGPFMLGKLWVKQQKFAQAVEAFSRAHELCPDDPDAIGQRGITFFRMIEPERALEDLKKSYALSPFNIEYACALQMLLRATRDFEGALKVLTHMIRWLPELDVLYKDRGEIYRELGRHQEAFDDFQKAHEKNADDANMWIALGSSLASLERFAEALEPLNRAIDLQSNEGIALALRAYCRERLDGDGPLVMEDLERSVQLMPEIFQTRYILGYHYLDREQWPETIAQFDKAIELSPDNGECHYQRAYAKIHLRRKTIAAFKEGEVEDSETKIATLKACIADIERALQLQYTEDGLFIELCACYNDLGDSPKALAALEKAMETEPECANQYLWRAHLRRLLNDPEGAAQDTTRMEELQKLEAEKPATE
jgi:tetratricopeptide (TPR) repeat protein